MFTQDTRQDGGEDGSSGTRQNGDDSEEYAKRPERVEISNMKVEMEKKLIFMTWIPND